MRYLEWRTAKGPLVYRSPSTRGPQDVMGVYTVQEWTPSFGWRTRRRRRLPCIASPPACAPFACRLWTGRRRRHAATSAFRFAFAWVNARTSAPLGATVVLPNVASDHQCITWFRPCETGPGWIRTGRLSTHGGGW